MYSCAVCLADESREALVEEVFRADDKYVLVKNIPAQVCARCGEESFSARTAESIRLMVNGGATRRHPFRWMYLPSCYKYDNREKRQMTSVPEIQGAIMTLDESDYRELMQWMNKLDWERWDAQIEADSKSGKLDFLEAEALEAKRDGTLREL